MTTVPAISIVARSKTPSADLEAEPLAQALHLRLEGPADLVVVTELEPEGPVHPILRRSRPSENLQRPHVPLVERSLGLGTGRRVAGQALDPVLAVADVELLLLEDPLDGARPRAPGAAAAVLELG